MNIHVRWCIRRDLPFLVDIESQLFAEPWAKDYFMAFLQRRDAICMVAEVLDKPVGYMAYSLNSLSIQLLRIAVHPRFHRCRIGTAMMAKLKSKLSPHRRFCAICAAPEKALALQLLLRSCGFLAEGCADGRISMCYTSTESL